MPNKLKKSLIQFCPNTFFLLSRIKQFLNDIPVGLRIVNFIFQRILGINKKVPWMVHFTSTVTSPYNIKIGKGVKKSFAVSGNCYIQGGNGIIIGAGTIFAPGCKVISANHDQMDLDKHLKDEPIVIGEYCWIGTNAVLLPGVTLGNNCVVGAGAVVTKSFPERSVLVGVPARRINNG